MSNPFPGSCCQLFWNLVAILDILMEHLVGASELWQSVLQIMQTDIESDIDCTTYGYMTAILNCKHYCNHFEFQNEVLYI